MGFPILVRWHLYIESGPWHCIQHKDWTHKWHPIACLHRWAMVCLLWIFLKEIDVITKQHCIPGAFFFFTSAETTKSQPNGELFHAHKNKSIPLCSTMEAWLSGGQWGRVQLMAWHLAANALGPLPAAIGQVNEPDLDASTASGLALCCSVLTSIPHWGSMEYTARDYSIKPALFSQIFSMYHI